MGEGTSSPNVGQAKNGDFSTCYGFSPDFPLNAALDDLRADYERHQTIHASTPRRRAKAAKKAAEAAQALLDALTELDRTGGGYLLNDDHALTQGCHRPILAERPGAGRF